MPNDLILVIDDNEMIRNLASEILALHQYRVIQACNVASGISQAQELSPDLILCDVFMPDGTGFHVLEQVQAIPELQATPFIFMSGEAIHATDIRQGMISGADDYLLKPFKIDELLATVGARLSRQKQFIKTAQFLNTSAGLPPFVAGNRSDLLNRLLQSQGGQSCVIALEIERFESYRQVLGDEKVKQLAHTAFYRLQHTEDLPFSLMYAGERPEISYIYAETLTQIELEQALQQLPQRVQEPLTFETSNFRVGMRAGAACSQGSQNQSDLLKNSELALFHAKAQAGTSALIYQDSMKDHLLENLRLEDILQRTLQEQGFVLYFQPQFDLKSQRVVAFEALLRLPHPTQKGLISPGLFIPVAESSGLILPIGAWVLAEACQTLARLNSRFGPIFRMAVNVSLIQFNAPQFSDQVAAIVQSSGISPEQLELELTESLLLERFAEAKLILDTLKGLGVSLAIDDFGTGYSSLVYLEQLPFDLLKIDQGFVSTLDDRSQSQAISRAIVDLGHSLNMQILAEGIETQQQYQILQELGCEFGQGFLVARPMPEADLYDWLAKQMTV